MIKTISLLHARSGMSQAEFIARYEHVHVPLVEKLLGPLAEYRRDYVDRDFGARIDMPELLLSEPDFDVVTTLGHVDQMALENLGEKLSTGDVRDRISDDERENFDRPRMVMFMVDDLIVAHPQSSDAITEVGGCRLMFAGYSSKTVVEMSSAGEEHALLADHFLRRGVNRVVRNRIPPGGIFDLKHIDGYAGRVDFDTLLELEFTSDGQLRSFLGKSNELGASLMKVFEHPRLGSKITGFVARPPGASDDDFAL